MYRRFLIGCAAVILFVGSADAVCWEKENPAVVLKCYQTAMERKNLEEVGALLANDYTLQYVPGPIGAAPSGRAEQLKACGEAFAAVEALELEFSDSLRVETGEEPHTWKLVVDGLVTRVTVVGADGTAVEHEVDTKKVEIIVREVAKPSVHYEIVQMLNYLE